MDIIVPMVRKQLMKMPVRKESIMTRQRERVYTIVRVAKLGNTVRLQVSPIFLLSCVSAKISWYSLILCNSIEQSIELNTVTNFTEQQYFVFDVNKNFFFKFPGRIRAYSSEFAYVLAQWFMA